MREGYVDALSAPGDLRGRIAWEQVRLPWNMEFPQARLLSNLLLPLKFFRDQLDQCHFVEPFSARTSIQLDRADLDGFLEILELIHRG